MNDAIKRYLDAATSLGELTKKRAEGVARQLVRQGEAASDQVGDLVDELLQRQRRNREAVVEMVRAETQRAVRLMGLATSQEVERLETELAGVKKELSAARAMAAEAASSDSDQPGAADGSGDEPSSGKTAKARTAAAKRTSKAGKASTKKATSKTSKKTAARSTTKKSAKKSTKKKSAKKSTSKKSGSRKKKTSRGGDA